MEARRGEVHSQESITRVGADLLLASGSCFPALDEMSPKLRKGEQRGRFEGEHSEGRHQGITERDVGMPITTFNQKCSP